MTESTKPSAESRQAALNRVSQHEYKNVDEFIAAVDRLARYIETGEIPAQGAAQ